jgi:hypothetical protein
VTESAVIRRLEPGDGQALIAITRACPIEADFAFYFDRSPHFFAWPDAVYDRHRYLGLEEGGRLVSFVMEGRCLGWVGDGWGDWFYGGDGRTLPEVRGQGLIRRLSAQLATTLDPQVELGLCLIKQGNEAAERAFAAIRPSGFWTRPLGSFDAANLLLLTSLGAPRSCAVRHATDADVGDMVALMARAYAGRLYAPRVTESWLMEAIERRAGLSLDRFYLAERGGRLVGLLAAWDMGALKRTTVMRYSTRARIAKSAYRLARLILRSAAALPGEGEALHSLYVTWLAVPDRDPEILRDLLRAVVRDHLGRGYHMIHVGLTGDDPLRGALRRWPVQHFRSGLHVVARETARWRDVLSREQDPYVDIAWI